LKINKPNGSFSHNKNEFDILAEKHYIYIGQLSRYCENGMKSEHLIEK
jgi:hypothetical protein